MIKIGIILGSVRENRVSPSVGNYFLNKAQEMNLEDATFELVDLRDYNLPEFKEPQSPQAMDSYSSETIERWAEKVASFDGYLFITPEYNGAITPSLKNAFDHLGGEWSNKAAGIVSYGSTLGIKSAMNLRTVLTNFNIAHMGTQGAFSLWTDFEDGEFKPQDHHQDTIESVIRLTVDWSRAMKILRK